MHSGDDRKRRLMAWPTGKTETTENTESTERGGAMGSALNGTKLRVFVEEYGMDASRGHAVEK